MKITEKLDVANVKIDEAKDKLGEQAVKLRDVFLHDFVSELKENIDKAKEEIDKIYLNFSCPFPKAAYATHRLTHIRFLEIYKRIMKKDAEPVIFTTSDYDAYIDVITLLKETPDIYTSAEFFTSGKNLCIVLHPTPTLTEKLITQLCEFGDVSLANKKDLAQLYEMGLS